MLCYLALDAWAGRVPSWKRVTTAIDGCTPWNMRSFFAVQMVRQRRVIIFMNIGVFDFLLRLLITSKIVVGACIWTCIDPSKKLPNDIERKVCKSFFTARAAEFTIIIEPCFFLVRIFLVLNLSLMRTQKKTLYLFWQMTTRLPGHVSISFFLKRQMKQMMKRFYVYDLIVWPHFFWNVTTRK